MKTSRFLVTALAALAMGLLPRLVSADAIPGLRDHDHTGVPFIDLGKMGGSSGGAEGSKR